MGGGEISSFGDLTGLRVWRVERVEGGLSEHARDVNGSRQLYFLYGVPQQERVTGVLWTRSWEKRSRAEGVVEQPLLLFSSRGGRKSGERARPTRLAGGPVFSLLLVTTDQW